MLRTFASTPTRIFNRFNSVQPRILTEHECLQPSSPIPTRFDWRLRSSSRQPTQNQRQLIKRVPPPQTPVQPGDPFYDEITAYQSHFLALLDADQHSSSSLLQTRLSTYPLSRLRAEGYALTGLSAFWLDATQFGRPVAGFLIGPGVGLGEHRFENGTQVLVSRLDPLKDAPIHGSILAHTATQLRVSFQEQFDELEDGTWRLDVGRSNIAYDRMRAAISHLSHDPSLYESPTSADRQLIIHGTHLRDVLLRTFSPFPYPHAHVPLQALDDTRYAALTPALVHPRRADDDQDGAFRDDMRIMSWARRYANKGSVVRVEGDPVLSGLNDTQVRAVAMMLGERVSLVQGPPGTGKTKTIIEAIKLLKIHFEVPHPLLVCTYTNAAVDNLVQGLVSSGVKPLRVGYGGKVSADLYPHTLDHHLAQHPLRKRVEGLAKEEERLEKRVGEIRRDGTGMEAEKREKVTGRIKWFEKKLSVVRAKMYALQQEMLRDVIAQADVICTTCITSACAALNAIDFPVVFLDEASMSTEPASLIPLMKGSRHVALIGDHKQLPPVITSREAQADGLGISLFERLTEEGVVPSIMLDVQYRMHPAISRFPSSEFYNLALQDGTVDSITGEISSGLMPPASSHLEMDALTGDRPSVVFLDHAGSESMKDRSRVNWNEAHIICSVVEDLLLHNETLRGSDIGIIAPYVAQISLLTRLLNTDAKYRTRFSATLGDHRALQLPHIEIKTVDGFEGREKDVVIFSTVRNNPGGYIGFLADRRRLNVGLTRAKRGLFVVGSLSTLRAGKMSSRVGENGEAVVRVGKGAEAWRRYAEFLGREGLVVQLSGDKLKKALYGNVSVDDEVKRMVLTTIGI